ncbi:unnamed protein product [Arctogadus glacialis]
MKPPPRQRILTKRYEERRTVRKQVKQVRDRRGLMENVCTWGVTEQRKLLKGLEWLKRHSRVEPDIDYEWLQKRVPKRSIEQLCTLVCELKVRAVSRGASQLRRQRSKEAGLEGEEPLQLWRETARFVAGDLEGDITKAFSQMLVVSSTEPQTPSDSAVSPPRSGHAQPPTTGPVTPGPLPPRGPSPVLQTPVVTLTPVLQTPVVTLTRVRGPLSGSPVGVLVPPSTPGQGPSATPSVALPGAGCQAAASTPLLPRLSQASAVAGATDKPGSRVEPVGGPGDAGQQEQRSKCFVDFQKIYMHLSHPWREGKDGPLSPLECAVVLDLLMALPEELPLLDGGKLRQHMIETYASLSAPVPAPAPRAERGDVPPPPAAANRPGPAPAEAARSRDAAGEHNYSNGRGERVVAAKTTTPPPEPPLCPLNPFQLPLKLLMKRS